MSNLNNLSGATELDWIHEVSKIRKELSSYDYHDLLEVAIRNLVSSEVALKDELTPSGVISPVSDIFKLNDPEFIISTREKLVGVIRESIEELLNSNSTDD